MGLAETMTAIEYVERELRRAELSFSNAMKKSGVKQEEVNNIKNKIQILEYIRRIVIEHEDGDSIDRH